MLQASELALDSGAATVKPRHTSITNAAAAGTPSAALMSRARHTDFKTTQLCIDLAGETFREEANRLERRLWGEPTSTTRESPH